MTSVEFWPRSNQEKMQVTRLQLLELQQPCKSTHSSDLFEKVADAVNELSGSLGFGLDLCLITNLAQSIGRYIHDALEHTKLELPGWKLNCSFNMSKALAESRRFWISDLFFSRLLR